MTGSRADTTWADRMMREQDVLPSPVKAPTLNLTAALHGLRLAGLGPVIESYNTIRLGDGRRARIAQRDHGRTRNPSDDEPSLLLVPLTHAHEAIGHQIDELARAAPNVIFAGGANRRVWVDGRQALGTGPPAHLVGNRYAVFAVARIVTALGGTTHDIAEQTGLSIGQVGDAIALLGAHIEHTTLGWEAADMVWLMDFALATYPGAGGIVTDWHHEVPVDEQATMLIAAGASPTGRWAASRQRADPTVKKIVVYAPTMPDMAQMGFRPAGVEPDRAAVTTSVIIPEDPTLFLTSRYLSYPTGRVDRFITVADLLNGVQTPGARSLLNDVRGDILVNADTTYDLRWDLPD